VIRVETALGAYDVHCRWGALGELGELMRDAGLRGRAFIIADDAVAARYGDRACTSLAAGGFEPAVHAFPAGEASKNLDTVRTAYDWLLDQRAERSSPVVALGGGVTGDLGGFVAATYVRGVPFVQAPTTLLAMADASIGGKVGVDHPRGKNLIGAFYPPRLVVQDTSLLATLPEREVRSGFGEIIKHGLIRDPEMLDLLERDADALLAREETPITDLVRRNAAIKAAVVSADERESELRAILNYGHTTAHAIEAVTGYQALTHGEADSIGMMVAAEIGRRMGVTPPSVAERQARLFGRYGLPLRHHGLDPDAVVAATRLDKKIAAGRLRWVLLEAEGKPVLRDDVPDAIVRETLAAFVA
jgi:3-dehydroquinate synthase